MIQSKINSSAATDTRNRISDVVPYSGLCSVCLDGCPGRCEIWKTTFRGREVIYPVPYGQVTAGATKTYPVDFSCFNIQGTCVGAVGIEPDPDKATFPNVDVSTEFGAREKIRLKVPIFTGALGSTEIARKNWEAMAVGAAISGIMVVVGENVCGVDPGAEFKKGRLLRSPELERRVRHFQEWYEGYGTIVVQQNVEDNRVGVPEYAIEKLGVQAIEIKWGQGAKDIGGEIKVASLEDAKELKKRGYILIPDPDDPVVVKAYEEGEFKEFERHSRLGMVQEKAFHQEVERLRSLGAKWVTLKTGAYRPADLARAIKYSSDAEIDLLTIDGSGGGTGMSPWRMMNEWGIPTVYLESLAYKMLEKLDKKGAFIPDIAIAGGLSLEDQVFKALALGAPYVKAACMGRATLIPAMVGRHTEEWLKEGTLPKGIREYGRTVEEIFILAEELKSKYGKDFSRLPLGAIGLYTYCDRIAVGLRQLMAGARKFALKHIARSDLMALTPEAAEVSGIPYVMDADREEVEKILG